MYLFSDSNFVLPPPPPPGSNRLVPKTGDFCPPGIIKFSDGSCGCPEGMRWQDPQCVMAPLEVKKLAPAKPLFDFSEDLWKKIGFGAGFFFLLLLALSPRR